MPEGGAQPSADVVITDYQNGVELARRIRSRERRGRASSKVIVMGDRARENEIRIALQSGVQGFVLHGCTRLD